MFDHILVPLDGSSLAECVLPHVVAVARAFDARVTLLQVMHQPKASGRSGFVDPLGWYMDEAEARAYLDRWSTRLHEADVKAESVILEGQAAERIIEFAHDQDISLIVLSSHGRSGLSRWNVSSIVFKIILRAYLPVMIVRAYQPITSELTNLRYRRLLTPLDCSRRAEYVLPLAKSLARYHEAEIVAVHVVSRPQMPRWEPLSQDDVELAERIVERNRTEAKRCLAKLESQAEITMRTEVVVAEDAAATLHGMVEQEDADLVLLSAHGYSGSSRWPYGSLVTNFINYGTSPLLIVQDISREELERSPAEIVSRERKGH